MHTPGTRSACIRFLLPLMLKSTEYLYYFLAAYRVGETLSIGVCSLTQAHAHDLLNSETKLYFPSFFCWVSYNKLKLLFMRILRAQRRSIFVMLLTCTALPSHSDHSLISHSYPSPIPWMCLSIAVTVTSVLYFQSRRMNCSGREAVCRGNSLRQQYHHVVGKLGKYCKVHVFT